MLPKGGLYSNLGRIQCWARRTIRSFRKAIFFFFLFLKTVSGDRKEESSGGKGRGIS